MKSLKDVDNRLPFTGERKCNFKVVCADPKIDTLYFSESSIFCRSEEDYYKQCSELNITPRKEYTVTSVYGVGDLFDITVTDDNGDELEIMDAYFVDLMK